MILLEVHDGLLAEPLRILPVGNDQGWRVLTPCEVDPPENPAFGDLAAICPLLREAADHEGGIHFEVFNALMLEIFKRAPSGQQLKSMFNAKQLHYVGEINVHHLKGQSKPATVYQFEKERTRVRVLWLYGEKRMTLILTHMFIKPGGKKSTTPPVQVDRAGTIYNSYVSAVERGVARLIHQQGGRDGFEGLGRCA